MTEDRIKDLKKEKEDIKTQIEELNDHDRYKFD